MRKTLLFLFVFIFGSPLFSQQLYQTVRGVVVDKESNFPLMGVQVKIITDSSGKLGAATNEDGVFVIEKVPVGRHSIEFRYLGYEPRLLGNINVSSAKEIILTVEMEESVSLTSEVVVQVKKDNADPGNEMATVSARSFTVEETDRFAGSRGDPSRMASNFAGVQGANDSRNDIVVRGNSPAGVLWRLEGIDIPNPNHFAISGTTGGPVNIINNKMLANSDFYTGAFPAEFGNATAAIFDLKYRAGNNQKHERSFQFGFMGTELFAEGPLNKSKGSSYLIGYRYSSLALFNALKIDIGTNAVPKYQDGSFKLNFPLKNNAVFSLWAIGGHSKIDIKISEQDPEERNIYGQNDRDQFFTSYMGVAGMSYSKSFNANTYFKVTAAASNQTVVVKHVYLFYNADRDTLLKSDPLLQYTFVTNTYNTHATINHKIGKNLTFKAGIIADIQRFSFHDSARSVDIDSNTNNFYLQPWTVRWDADVTALLLRGYAQMKYKMNQRTTFNIGWYTQFHSLTGQISAIEPRAGMRYDIDSKSSFTFGTGIHSQTQSPYIYFYRKPGAGGTENNQMGFTKSFHSVAGYERKLGKTTRIKFEAYYQYLYDIPVGVAPSSFSLINTGSGFTRFFPDKLENKGIGRNMGIEMTLERHFSGNYYFLLTASLFDAKYQGSDGIWRNTDFNGRYAVNALFTKEFKIGKNSGLQVGAKVTSVGGRYYSPADINLSNQRSELIELDSAKNTLQTPAYFRFDLRVSYKWNRTKVSHEFALDIVNVLNTKNVLGLTYAPDPNGGSNVRFEYQLSRLPLFYYRLDF